MESNYLSTNPNKEKNIDKSLTILDNIKSNYFLEEIIGYLKKSKSLKIVKYNKKIQKRLNLSIQNYKDYSKIEIELIPSKDKYGKFINITNKKEKSYFHFYFNDEEKEIKKNTISESDKVIKIKIIIDYQVKTFKNLFKDCQCIESINFIQFNRNNINNMGGTFSCCLSLKKLCLSNFNTDNVTNMGGMFSYCQSLKSINISNFNTVNVTNMGGMFNGCLTLEDLNISNINTNNVTNIGCMFSFCKSLKKINLSNFKTDKVNNMGGMFYGCSALEELNISNFNINDNTVIKDMFHDCSDKLKQKIREQIKNLKDEAF